MVLKRIRFTCAYILLLASAASGSDLSDGMQMFFEGKYQEAQQRLTALLSQEQQDPRVFYFRGLTQRRMGNIEAAVADFQRGAQLEARGFSKGVGQALQRVQGQDRLLLEKHRTMVRLATRHRGQPVAPKPIIRNPVKLTTATMQTNAPVFRLASEVPIRTQLAREPADDTSMLASETIPRGPSAVPSSIPPEARQTSTDEPVGTGVALADESNSDFNPFVDDSEFSSEPVTESTTDAAATSPSQPRGKTSGVFGAVFRALTRAAVPRVDALLPPGIVPQSRPEPSFDVGDDIFGDDQGDALQEGDAGEDDPFGGF